MKRTGENGLSLIEVVIAVALLTIAFTPLIGLFITSRKSADDSARRVEALALARAAMDNMAARESWASIANYGPAPHYLDTAYTLTVTVTERTPYLKDIVIDVGWNQPGGDRSVTIQSAVHRREGLQ